MADFSEYLKESNWNIELHEEQIKQLEMYTQLLLEWNEKINLTAIIDPKEIAVKHYLDSLSLLHFAPPEQGAAILDVGSGAGFPGIVLKIARPDLHLTCMDGTQKRVHFLTMLAETLHLQEVNCLHARAEEAGRQGTLRETFDYVTARAVSNLRMLCEYCLPFVKIGGRFVAMKGPDGETEAHEAQKAIHVLGGKIAHISTFTLPATAFSRTLVEIIKTANTPVAYPRSSGIMKKRPL
ncbi:MAG: 16S rRNA (guanine(527)-N(7))-methyltransferase RsmG [Ethanoligenens sp.]|uniref:16S rRNA (guanine(527)-N(7))-methyltransferase RsmG n=1 Tax=Ethanoligenens sp. TaxID=2099655 RepID=UPI0039E92054